MAVSISAGRDMSEPIKRPTLPYRRWRNLTGAAPPFSPPPTFPPTPQPLCTAPLFLPRAPPKLSHHQSLQHTMHWMLRNQQCSEAVAAPPPPPAQQQPHRAFPVNIYVFHFSLFSPAHTFYQFTGNLGVFAALVEREMA